MVTFIFFDSVQTEPLVIQKEREIVPIFHDGSEEDFLQAREKVERSVVGFYQTSIATDQKKPSQKDFLGNGMVLSTDGWLVTLEDALSREVAENRTVVWIQGALYTPEHIVRDPATPFVFVKVVAENLTVVRLSDLSDTIALGEHVFSMTHDGQVIRTSLQSVSDVSAAYVGEYVRTTEVLAKRAVLQKVWQDSLVGAPVFAHDGTIIGMVQQSDVTPEDTLMVSALHMSDILDQVFREQAITRIFFGAQYLFEDVSIDQGGQARTTLVRSSKRPAILAGSPAADAGLREGDVILLLNNEFIRGNKDFTELVQEYQPGSEVVITYERLGVQKEAKVVLEALEE